MAGLVASKMRRARDKELKDAKDGDDKESKKNVGIVKVTSWG